MSYLEDFEEESLAEMPSFRTGPPVLIRCYATDVTCPLMRLIWMTDIKGWKKVEKGEGRFNAAYRTYQKCGEISANRISVLCRAFYMHPCEGMSACEDAWTEIVGAFRQATVEYALAESADAYNLPSKGEKDRDRRRSFRKRLLRLCNKKAKR